MSSLPVVFVESKDYADFFGGAIVLLLGLGIKGSMLRSSKLVVRYVAQFL